jgi:hypothetical protein
LITRARSDFVCDVLWLNDLLLFGSTSAISSHEYGMLRLVLLVDPRIGPALPRLVRECATLQQFRALVDQAFPGRSARQKFLMEQFEPLIALAGELARLPNRRHTGSKRSA